jgi:crotonobetainyl-CoA:carnitine CoA-transferase CaiB-like acyl-CoA transferase
MQQTKHQPLTGIRIVDMTHDWAGPHTTRILADYGAEVIKIEYPRRLCIMRGAFLDKINNHPRWWEINRNKGSITLDLHLPEHVQAFKDLVRESDVVVDNSRPGVMERFGLGYEVLKTIRPDIIMVCMSAYGATGPESSYAGYGGAIEAISGVQSLTAYDRDGDKLRVREVDVTNGIMGACAIMTALIARQASGEGQYIDLSQREASTWLIGEHLLEFVVNGTQTLPLGNRHPSYAPQGCYRCQGDDRWIVLTIRSDAEWVTFCSAVSHPEWSQEKRFADVEGRTRHQEEIDHMIESWTVSLDNHQAMAILQANGLAAGAVCDCHDLAVDPHLEAREWFVRLAGQENAPYPGFPFRFINAPGGVLRQRGPDLGADNTTILCNRLGWNKAQLPPLTTDSLGTAYDLE